MDFGTSANDCSAPPANDWAVAAADGNGYHPEGCSCWFRIDHSAEWATSYYHLRDVRGNGSINRNDGVGTIACEICPGHHGSAPIPHIHFSLRYNGAYTELDGTQLSGWTIYEGNGTYGSGYIERDGQIKYPYQYVYNDGGGPTPTLNFITKLQKRDWCGNHSTGVYIEVRNVGAASHIFRQFVVTDQYGRYNGLPLSGVSPGTYDIYAKGQSHLARGKGSVNISAGVNEIDFSDWHTVYLLGGDFDGDNVISILDYSRLVANYATADPCTDLDGSGEVNILDYSIFVWNYTKEGDGGSWDVPPCGTTGSGFETDTASTIRPNARSLLSLAHNSGKTAPRSLATSSSFAWLSLSPNSGTYNVGDTFEVAILLDTGDSAVDGIDAILYYDPTVLEAVEVREGSISEFTSYPHREVDPASGTILLSGSIETSTPSR